MDQDTDLFGEPINDRYTASKEAEYLRSLFDQWWAHYPRKLAVGKARETFYKQLKAGKFAPKDVPAMVATLKWQTTELWLGRSAVYIPHGSTYLNQERWKDTKPTRTGEAFGQDDEQLPF